MPRALDGERPYTSAVGAFYSPSQQRWAYYKVDYFPVMFLFNLCKFQLVQQLVDHQFKDQFSSALLIGLIIQE